MLISTYLTPKVTDCCKLVLNKKEVKETENDLRYIKTGDLKLKSADYEFFSSYKHYILLIIPFFLFVMGLFLMKQHIKANSNLQLVKERKAVKLAKKQLSIAEKHLKTNSKDLFFDAVLNALNNYIGDKFTMSVVDFSKEKTKIIAANYGNKYGVPAIFPKAFINDLLKITGDKGAKEFLQENRKEIISPEVTVNLLDIDTPEEYNNYLNTL